MKEEIFSSKNQSKNRIEVSLQPGGDKRDTELVSELRQRSDPEWRNYLKIIVDFFKKRSLVAPTFCCELSLAFLSLEEMRKVNFQYRKMDRPTDILSFDYEREFDSQDRIKWLEGELLFCLPVVEKYAQENQKTPREEFCLDLVHGCLHLVGFEHSKEMFALQEKLAETLAEAF